MTDPAITPPGSVGPLGNGKVTAVRVVFRCKDAGSNSGAFVRIDAGDVVHFSVRPWKTGERDAAPQVNLQRRGEGARSAFTRQPRCACWRPDQAATGRDGGGSDQ